MLGLRTRRNELTPSGDAPPAMHGHAMEAAGTMVSQGPASGPASGPARLVFA